MNNSDSENNIDKRKSPQQALLESEALVGALTRSIQDAVIIMNPEGRISFWNPAATRILGYTADEVLGQNLHQLLAPQRYHQQHHDVLPRFRQTGTGNIIDKTSAMEALHKDGHEIAVEMSTSAIFLADGWHAIGVIRDITERRQNETALLRRAEMQSALREIAEAAVLAATMDELYTTVYRIIGRVLTTTKFQITLLGDAAEENILPGNYLSMPLVDSSGKPFGVLSLVSADDNQTFQPEDIEALSIVAAQVSMAIERKRLENELQRQATTDELTGLSNRRHFLCRATEELKRLERYGGDCIFLILDIDHFKTVNDIFGHSAGDEALRHVASICKDTLRSSDLLGRIGGEEFAALLIEVSEAAGLQAAERLRKSVQNMAIFTEDGRRIELTVSIGLAKRQYIEETLSQLMKRADAAMYQAKTAGRNQTAINLEKQIPFGDFSGAS